MILQKGTAISLEGRHLVLTLLASYRGYSLSINQKILTGQKSLI